MYLVWFEDSQGNMRQREATAEESVLFAAGEAAGTVLSGSLTELSEFLDTQPDVEK